MSSAPAMAAHDIEGLTCAVSALLEDGAAAELPNETVERLAALALRAYAARFEAGEMRNPVAEGALTATEAAVACRGLLRAVDMELFELTLWGSAFPSESDRT